MAKVTLEQAMELLRLIVRANVAAEAVQRTLIERFDLLQIMMEHPHAVKGVNRSAFEAFIRGSSPSAETVLQMLESHGEEYVAAAEYGYPSGWCLRALEEQLDVLRALFPELRCEAQVPPHLPEGAEGWLLVPKPQRIGNTYHEALETVLGHLGEAQRPFCNARQGELGPQHLRLTQHSLDVLDELDRCTPGDYFLLAIQSGLRHRATSVADAQARFGRAEFGLGPLEIATLLLTHPDRLGDYQHLGIDCPGCLYSPNADDDQSYSLYFIWDGEGICLDYSSAEGNAPGFGSASGFAP